MQLKQPRQSKGTGLTALIQIQPLDWTAIRIYEQNYWDSILQQQQK